MVSCQVDPEDFAWDVSGCLASCAQSFTKADHHRMLLPRPFALQPDLFYKISAAIRVQTINSSFCQQCRQHRRMKGVSGLQHLCELHRSPSLKSCRAWAGHALVEDSQAGALLWGRAMLLQANAVKSTCYES